MRYYCGYDLETSVLVGRLVPGNLKTAVRSHAFGTVYRKNS